MTDEQAREVQEAVKRIVDDIYEMQTKLFEAKLAAMQAQIDDLRQQVPYTTTMPIYTSPSPSPSDWRQYYHGHDRKNWDLGDGGSLTYTITNCVLTKNQQ